MTAHRFPPTLSGSVTGGAVVWDGAEWVNAVIDLANLAAPIADIVQTGTAAPSSGTHGRGEIIWNTAPSAGGTPGWVCVTAGTPGTWKAMANVAA